MSMNNMKKADFSEIERTYNKETTDSDLLSLFMGTYEKCSNFHTPSTQVVLSGILLSVRSLFLN